MARRLRLQIPGAMYHVINRGNYRADVFREVGSAKAFETTLDETCTQFGWRVHAYVIMRNHYHLALETPEPNLVEGMHWLQSTFATRFNRFRNERGHLFQGRYQALLIENAVALTRVVNYIHLNPVRARIVSTEEMATFRWSSLGRFRRSGRPQWLSSSTWLTALGCADTRAGWEVYQTLLTGLAAERSTKGDEEELCTGWAIGTHGWRRAIAKEHSHLSVHVGVEADELREVRQARWTELLTIALREYGKSLEEVADSTKGAEWKCCVAEKLRHEAAVPHAWIAEMLHMGTANSVRSHLSRRRRGRNQQLSA